MNIVLLFVWILNINSGAFAEEADSKTSDPFNVLVDEHSSEYGRYLTDYYAKYHALDNNPAEPKEMDSGLDANGRPKWIDGPHGQFTLANLVLRLFVKEQFDDLERLFAEWSDPANRMADGKWKLSVYTLALDRRYHEAKAWDNDYRILQKWREKNPKSIAAAMAEVSYWSAYAWDARGNGYINTVTKDGYALFQERLHKAQKVLNDCKDYAAKSPIWYEEYIGIALGLEWPNDKKMELFEEAVSHEKYYYGSYFPIVSGLMPQWGGNWQEIDNYIKHAVLLTNDKEGHAMYARLYWYVNQHTPLEFNLFHDSLASWPEMKKGFDDLMRLYPHSAWNINNYASFACMAGDKETFQSLRFRIGSKVLPDAWPSNMSMDLCEHKFATQPL